MNIFIDLRTYLIGLCIVLASCESKSVNLRINANVDDATVYINGKQVGTAPMDILVEPGNLQVEVRQSGFVSFKKTYTLAAESSKFIEAKLQTKPIKAGNQTYKTIKIGDQVWMAENLNLKVPNSSCYGDNPANCEKYGRLYTWAAAKAAAAKMPGWHLPTDGEWYQLCEALGGRRDSDGDYPNIGAKLKNGSFNALLAGYRYGGGYFNSLGDSGLFWSASPNGSSYAWYRYVYASNSDVSRDSNNRTYRYSVRLVKDE